MIFRRRRDRCEDYAWLDSAISEYGWAVLYIPEGPDTTDEPSFHYTVGLTARQEPELIVYSLPYESGHGMLNAIAEQVTAGHTLREGEPVPGLPPDAPEIRTFAPQDCAIRLASRPRATAMQWPYARSCSPTRRDAGRGRRALTALG